MDYGAGWTRRLEGLVRALMMAQPRQLVGVYGVVARTIAAIFAGLYIYTAARGVFSPESHVGLFLGFTLVLVFLWFPALRRSPRDRFTVIDMVLALGAVAVTWYFIAEFPTLVRRAGTYTSADIGLGVLALVLSLEATRRVVGPVVPIVSIAFLLFAYRGIAPNLPALLAHRGFTLERIITYLYTSLDGLYGTVTYTFATHVFLFVIFGCFLERSGVGRFFIDLPYAILGRSPGGAAKVAVAGSALLGSVTGSPTANVVATGTFTIPLMKRAGYAPHIAGAIEAAASTGGQFLPPVMGAAAFFMVEFTGIPYIEIVKMAAIPALIYFLGVGAMVHFHAKRHGLRGADEGELRDWRKVLAEGWYFFVPLVVIIVQLVRGFSPGVAAFWGLVSTVVVSWIRPQTRMGPREIYEALVDGARNTVLIASVAGSIGIIVGIIGLTGLGLRFSTIILSLAGESLFLTMALTALTALILGMGAPITATYVILAVLVPPALARLGVSTEAAHLTLIWYSQLSGLTPPVCLVAYAAAAMAKADPFRTGFAALRFGAFLILMPLLFVYTPLLSGASPAVHLFVVATAAIAAITFAAFLEGQWSRPTTGLERLALGIGTAGLFTVAPWANVLGLALVAAVHLRQRLTSVSRASLPV